MAALNVEIDDDLHKRLKVACGEREISLKDAAAIAVEAWLGERSPPSSAEELPPRFRPYVQKLIDVFLRGDKDVKASVADLIDAFHVRLPALQGGVVRKEP